MPNEEFVLKWMFPSIGRDWGVSKITIEPLADHTTIALHLTIPASVRAIEKI